MNEIRVKAGTIIHTDINFIGEPIPEVTWTVNSKPVVTDTRTTITSIGYHTVLHIVNAKRSDSGSYHLLLKNNSGTDEGTLQVVVLGADQIVYVLGFINFTVRNIAQIIISRSPWTSRGAIRIRRSNCPKRDPFLETTKGQRRQRNHVRLFYFWKLINIPF